MTQIKVLVLYYSRQGSIKALSREVAEGIESVFGCEAIVRTVPAVSTECEAVSADIPGQGDIYATADDLDNCDGLVLGSPTRFGSIASPLKYFFDQSTDKWLSGALADKPAGVFTSSNSLHGGQESTLLAMMVPLLHHGMMLIGLPYYGTDLDKTKSGGAPYGASHVAGSNGNELNDGEKKLAQILGQRVAKCTVKQKQ